MFKSRGLQILVSIVIFASAHAAVDLIIFSKDRPLQLTAFLESLQRQVTGLASVAVLYHAKNDAFEQAYEWVQSQFQDVVFLQQQRKDPRADFMQNLKKILAGGNASYMMFAVDDMIVVNPADCALCVAVMQKIPQVYVCSLRLGCNINHCYATNQPSPCPLTKEVAPNLMTWSLAGAAHDWGYPHSVDMAIYRRSLVEKFCNGCRATTPNTFEGIWSSKAIPQGALGLCYMTSRVINIPMNLVQTDWGNRYAALYSVEELLELYRTGYRIDIEELFGKTYPTVHVPLKVAFKKVM